MKITKQDHLIMDDKQYLEITGKKSEMDYAYSQLNEMSNIDMVRQNDNTITVGPLENPNKVFKQVYNKLGRKYPWWKRIM